MSSHIVTSYDQELQNLRRSIAEMGGIAEKMVADSGQALMRRDSGLRERPRSVMRRGVKASLRAQFSRNQGNFCGATCGA